MGVDINASIWYGIVGEVPSIVYEGLDEDGEYLVDGLVIQKIWNYDTLTGIGIVLARSRDRIVLDPNELIIRRDRAIKAFDSFMRLVQTDLKPEMYLEAYYS